MLQYDFNKIYLVSFITKANGNLNEILIKSQNLILKYVTF